jgi:hypothetical protein
MTGTSQATAFVTGAAVRVLQSARAQGLDPSPEFVIEKLVATGSVSLELNGKTRKSTHLDRKEIEEMRPSLTAKSFRTQSQADFRIRFKEALRQEVSAGHGPL